MCVSSKEVVCLIWINRLNKHNLKIDGLLRPEEHTGSHRLVSPCKSSIDEI